VLVFGFTFAYSISSFFFNVRRKTKASLQIREDPV